MTKNNYIDPLCKNYLGTKEIGRQDLRRNFTGDRIVHLLIDLKNHQMI
jgi:hypothetical protein